MKRVQLLQRVPLFKDLDPKDLERLAEALQTETYPDATDIVVATEPGHSMFLILSGTVQVLYPARNDDFELARLGEGDFFGEMALLNSKPRSATVRTTEPVRVLVLERDDFNKIITNSPQVALKLLEVMSARIRNVDEQISELSDQAMRDALTSLLNRRAFHERLQEEANRARRYGDLFSLILLDIDHFKTVNDTFGHDVGDEVLSWIGRLLTEHTRAADTPFRVGGEEFAILAPATDAKVARSLAGRLVEVVSEAKPPAEFDLHITFSAGYASCPEHANQAPRIFTLADQALLKAKSEGRNRVSDPSHDLSEMT